MRFPVEQLSEFVSTQLTVDGYDPNKSNHEEQDVVTVLSHIIHPFIKIKIQFTKLVFILKTLLIQPNRIILLEQLICRLAKTPTIVDDSLLIAWRGD